MKKAPAQKSTIFYSLDTTDEHQKKSFLSPTNPVCLHIYLLIFTTTEHAKNNVSNLISYYM